MVLRASPSGEKGEACEGAVKAPAKSIFDPLPRIPDGWACLHADPPWRFKSNSLAKPGRNALRHHACLSLSDIASLPVKDVAARDALAFLWVTGPFLAVGAHVPILEAWGFEPTAMAFVWTKTRADGSIFVGPGLTTRKSCEFVVIGKRGKPRRLAADVREAILAPVHEHSRKPSEIYERIERYCAGPRLDLFARESRAGWITWGAESTRFDQIPAPLLKQQRELAL
jgi:N6-adenosine-specific RNA methylase IME4